MLKPNTLKMLVAGLSVVMAGLAYKFGDVTPLVQDVCGALLPSDGVVETRPSVTVVEDAGAAR